MAKEIEVQITGKKFVFQLADDVQPEEFLQVVEYVENKINKIKSRMNELDCPEIGIVNFDKHRPGPLFPEKGKREAGADPGTDRYAVVA